MRLAAPLSSHAFFANFPRRAKVLLGKKKERVYRVRVAYALYFSPLWLFLQSADLSIWVIASS
jgi:hypothetical protein